MDSWNYPGPAEPTLLASSLSCTAESAADFEAKYWWTDWDEYEAVRFMLEARDYVLDAEIDESGAVSGEVDVILNGRSNVLVIEGTLDDGVLSLEFDGVTLVTQNIRAVWNGTVEADFD